MQDHDAVILQQLPADSHAGDPGTAIHQDQVKLPAQGGGEKDIVPEGGVIAIIAGIVPDAIRRDMSDGDPVRIPPGSFLGGMLMPFCIMLDRLPEAAEREPGAIVEGAGTGAPFKCLKRVAKASQQKSKRLNSWGP